MAQLVKLQDYISRYEWNPYHYPTQFIRLKKQNWSKLRKQWEDELMEAKELNEEKDSKMWHFFKRKNEIDEQYKDEQMSELSLINTETELIQYFLDKLFPFQMKWATSTLSRLSYIESHYNTDHTLKYFLQRFPDIYLVMYYPIFNIQKAPIDGEIILISPIGIELIKLIEKHPDITVMATDERTWTIESDQDVEKRLSPLIALRRNERIVKSILNKYNINFPVHKTILSRTNQIIYTEEPYNTRIVSKTNYEDWFNKKRALSAPLKSEQLKAMEALLLHCQTTSIKRPEWQDDDDIFLYSD